MQPQGVQRVRKLEDGDEIDLNAAIGALIDIRLGSQPDPRVMMRSVRKTRDISVLVLLDLSESTNDKVAGHDYTVLDLTRAATGRECSSTATRGSRCARAPTGCTSRPGSFAGGARRA